jgi:hypothetical protein
MQIHQSVISKLDWQYATRDDGTKVRFALHENKLIAQKRTVFPENSKRRLMQKALQGEYSLTDLQIRGAGNSYLVIGWENTEIFTETLTVQSA